MMRIQSQGRPFGWRALRLDGTMSSSTLGLSSRSLGGRSAAFGETAILGAAPIFGELPILAPESTLAANLFHGRRERRGGQRLLELRGREGGRGRLDRDDGLRLDRSRNRHLVELLGHRLRRHVRP